MRPLRDLRATYDHKDIGQLVDFTRVAPVELPEDGTYHFEMRGTTVHIYGVDQGIANYRVGDLGQGMSMHGITTTDRRVEINLTCGEVEKIVLHTETYRGATSPRTSRLGIAQSRESGSESRSGTPSYCGGESGGSESRKKSYGGRESRKGRESRSSTSNGSESR